MKTYKEIEKLMDGKSILRKNISVTIDTLIDLNELEEKLGFNDSKLIRLALKVLKQHLDITLAKHYAKAENDVIEYFNNMVK